MTTLQPARHHAGTLSVGVSSAGGKPRNMTIHDETTSIPLTPKQRLFLASNSYEDKEAALTELLGELTDHVQTLCDLVDALGSPDNHFSTARDLIAYVETLRRLGIAGES